MSQDYKVCEWCNNALDFGTTVCPFCGKSQMPSYQFDNQNQWKQGIPSPINDELKKKISKFIIIWALLYFLVSTVIAVLTILP